MCTKIKIKLSKACEGMIIFKKKQRAYGSAQLSIIA